MNYKKKNIHPVDRIFKALEIILFSITICTAIGCLIWCFATNTKANAETVTHTEPVITVSRVTIEQHDDNIVDTEPFIEPETEPIPTEYIAPYEVSIDIPETDLEMLACAIYCEHGGDTSCDMCRMRVGDVILNRIASPHFPNTMNGVLTQKSQYGTFHYTGVVWPERAANTNERNAVERAYRIAYNLLHDIEHSDLYGKNYIWQAEFHQGYDEVHCCGTYYGK